MSVQVPPYLYRCTLEGKPRLRILLLSTYGPAVVRFSFPKVGTSTVQVSVPLLFLFRSEANYGSAVIQFVFFSKN